MTFFFRALLLLAWLGLPGIRCDPLLPLFQSASQAGFAGLCLGYSDLLQHSVDVCSNIVLMTRLYVV